MTARAHGLCWLVALIGLGSSLPALAQPVDAQESVDTAENAETVEAHPAATAATSHLETIETLRQEFFELEKQILDLEGSERTVVAVQMRRLLLEWMGALDELVVSVVKLREDGVDTEPYRTPTIVILQRATEGIPPFLDGLDRDATALRKELEHAEGKPAADLLERIRHNDEVIDDVYAIYLEHLEHLDAFDLPSEGPREDLERRATKFAGTLSSRIELAGSRLKEAKSKASAAPGPDAEVALQTAQEEMKTLSGSLAALTDIMEAIDLETAEYRQIMIESSGKITGDVLDKKVFTGLIEQAARAAGASVRSAGPTLIARGGVFLGVLVIFWLLSRLAARVVGRFVGTYSTSLSELARRMIVGTMSRAVMALGVFVALAQIGFDVTALLTGLGIAGFIVGFALQDTLGNFASGTMILIYRPYDVGHIIEAAGVRGEVSGMNLVSTTILTPDNQTLVVPNSRIWGDVIRNTTSETRRRIDLTVEIAHSADLEQTEEILLDILRKDPRVLDDPAPAVTVHALTDIGVKLNVRPWVQTGDYWPSYWGITREMKLQLDRAGVPLGVPIRDVRVRPSEA